MRRREVVEARNQRLNSEVAALKQKVREAEEARKRAELVNERLKAKSLVEAAA